MGLHKQREICSQFSSEAVSLNAGSSNGTRNQISNMQCTFKNRADFKKHNLFCDYCKKSRHTKERCYKLHGFPNNIKGNKDRKIVAYAQGGNSESVSTSQNRLQSHLAELIAAQYNRLMLLLNDSSKPSIQYEKLDTLAAPISANFTSSSANLSGTVAELFHTYEGSYVFNNNCKHSIALSS
ncbi:putative transcription factor interactor and regulator CCHC(Zn) family [Dioscorea sansibarensis]